MDGGEGSAPRRHLLASEDSPIWHKAGQSRSVPLTVTGEGQPGGGGVSEGKADQPAAQKAFQGTSGKYTIVQNLFPETPSRVCFQVSQTRGQTDPRYQSHKRLSWLAERPCIHSWRTPLQRPKWGVCACVCARVHACAVRHQMMSWDGHRLGSSEKTPLKDSSPRPE